jgi:hypothetical protein
MTHRAWCDPVKSNNGAAVQLTPMKMDENKVTLLEKTEPAKESPKWLKRIQAGPRDVNVLRILEEKKRSQRVESLDKVIYSPEFSENIWKNEFSKPLYATKTKSSSSDSAKSTLKAYPGENASLEQSNTFTKLKLLELREETFKEIFMGVCFSFDLTNGHVILEMNVAPSTDKRSGFLIRF